jgi:hypothetical protein
LTLVGNLRGGDPVWDYRCECGQGYRAAETGRAVRFWPAQGVGGFSATWIPEGAACMGCGWRLVCAAPR